MTKAKRTPAPKKPQPEKPQPVSVSLTEDLAIAIAMGSAASTFEVVSAQTGANSGLPAGRFWYCGGVRPDADTDAIVIELAAFVDKHGAGVPGEALFIHCRRHFEACRTKIYAWRDLPLADRLAYAVFCSQLPPLLTEARAEAERKRKAEEVHTPPPDRGIYKRVKRGPRRLGRRVKLSHAVKEAAE